MAIYVQYGKVGKPIIYSTLPTPTAELKNVIGQVGQNIYLCDGTQWILLSTLAGSQTVHIDAPSTAVQGQLIEEQLAILQASDNNNLMFNHEKFYLNDKGHSEGFLTYTHVGIENDLVYIKTFTITINNLTWVMNIRSLPEFEYDATTKTLVITE